MCMRNLPIRPGYRCKTVQVGASQPIQPVSVQDKKV